MAATIIIIKVLFTVTKNKRKIKFQHENGYTTIYFTVCLCLYTLGIPEQITVQPLKIHFIITTNDFRKAEALLNECSGS